MREYIKKKKKRFFLLPLTNCSKYVRRVVERKFVYEPFLLPLTNQLFCVIMCRGE